MLMEMQFRIMEGTPSPGVSSWDITIRIVPEMGGQPSSSENGTDAVTDGEMKNLPERKEEPELFERLAGLRRQIASESGLPPYIIFHDSTLSEMCRIMPKDMQEMKSVQGVGEAKLAKYGQRFLDAIREYTLPGQQS
jgi:ATP-dependent DNA helicase RecQ